MSTPRTDYIVCPICGWTSWNLGDVYQRYCAHCHKFHDEFTARQIHLAFMRRRKLEIFLATRLGRIVASFAGIEPCSSLTDSSEPTAAS